LCPGEKRSTGGAFLKRITAGSEKIFAAALILARASEKNQGKRRVFSSDKNFALHDINVAAKIAALSLSRSSIFHASMLPHLLSGGLS
jgi:hypothetical protein